MLPLLRTSNPPAVNNFKFGLLRFDSSHAVLGISTEKPVSERTTYFDVINRCN
jgi:hypothetical protein